MAKLSLSLLLAFGLLAASGEAAASKEGLLPLNAFALESPGIGQSGPVKVSGAQSDGGISLLRIEAFGRNFTLQPQQLRSFKGFNANGVQISYEGGYVDLGGRTIYVVFSRGFTSGRVMQRFVAVTETGAVSVGNVP
jgi:hypothetical protein